MQVASVYRYHGLSFGVDITLATGSSSPPICFQRIRNPSTRHRWDQRGHRIRPTSIIVVAIAVGIDLLEIVVIVAIHGASPGIHSQT